MLGSDVWDIISEANPFCKCPPNENALFRHAVDTPLQISRDYVNHSADERLQSLHARPRCDHHYHRYRQSAHIRVVYEGAVSSLNRTSTLVPLSDMCAGRISSHTSFLLDSMYQSDPPENRGPIVSVITRSAMLKLTFAPTPAKPIPVPRVLRPAAKSWYWSNCIASIPRAVVRDNERFPGWIIVNGNTIRSGIE